MFTSTPARAGRNGYRQYHEVVTRRWGGGEFTILLKELDTPTLGQYVRNGRRLGAISAESGSLLSTGASVGTAVGLASTIGVWAGPVGAAAGAIVGIIAGLFEASAARAKGATTENEAINEYLPAWDSGMQQIFAAANAGTATPAECITAVQSLMSNWWAAAAQFHGLSGVADASHGGADCGTYVPGQTTACSPTGGPRCGKSCTAFCCVGCHDLMPSAQYAIYLFGLPQGGQLNVCTVYSSSYGASQRNSYTLTYTPPPASTAASASTVTGAVSSVANEATSAVSSLTGASSSMSFLLLAGLAALAAW